MIAEQFGNSMLNRKCTTGVLLIFSLCFANSVSAQPAGDCARLADDQRRLACYDALFRKEPGKPNPTAIQAVQTQEVQTAPIAAEAASDTTLVNTPVKPVVKTAEPKAPTFGSEQLKTERNPRVKSVKTRDTISSLVTRVSKRPRGEYVFELENGQIWTQITIGWIKVSVNDRVTIVKRRLGGYTLRSRGGVSTKVRRVK